MTRPRVHAPRLRHAGSHVSVRPACEVPHACGRAGIGRLLVLLLLAACGRRDATVPADAGGEFRLDWTVGDSSRGVFEAPARAGWCAARRELLVMAQRSDTGAGLLVAFDTAGWRADSLVLRPEVASPRAALVWRLVDQTTLRAYRADSGWAAVDDSSGTASGRFAGRLVTAQGDGSAPIRVAGRFTDVPVVADTACVPPAALPAPIPAPVPDSVAPTVLPSAGRTALPGAAVPAAGTTPPRR